MPPKSLKHVKDDELMHRRNALLDSAESLDPKSSTSVRISIIENELQSREVSVPGVNRCWGSNASGRKPKDDR